jgi:protein gp37
MALDSSIEWTHATWNPVTGCSHISAGCAHCYAERMALRLQAAGMPKYRNGFKVTTHEDELLTPQAWKKNRMVFLCSMGDLPFGFILRVFKVMQSCQQHKFQVLTKRSKRLRQYALLLPWPDNVWMGVTVEDTHTTTRVADLQAVPAKVRFLSCEPLLEDIRRAYEEGMGSHHQESVQKGGRGVLLQAVGRYPQASERSRTRRQDIRRHAGRGG